MVKLSCTSLKNIHSRVDFFEIVRILLEHKVMWLALHLLQFKQLKLSIRAALGQIKIHRK